jgi:hypothetical protein
MKRLALVLPVLAVLAAPAHGATLLRLDGIGPLKLGMSRMASLDTGWLSNRQTACTLGGKPYPIAYSLDGASAPKPIKGTIEFNQEKLTSLLFYKGVRTATGVVPGKTTVTGMVTRYRNAGFKVSARYDDVFAGTFVSVKRKHGAKQIMGAFGAGKVIDMIGVPFVPVCE